MTMHISYMYIHRIIRVCVISLPSAKRVISGRLQIIDQIYNEMSV